MTAFHLHLHRFFTVATSSLLLLIAILPHPINSLLLSNNNYLNYHGRVLHTPPPTLLYSTSTTTNDIAAVWQPPSQNKAKLNGHQGGVFDIESPEDLLDFIIDDGDDDDDDDDNSDSNRSLAVIKVYASWCRTCKQFDLRYKKIVNQFSTSNTKRNSNNKMKRRNNTVRFANMQYDNVGGINSEICNALYDGSIDSFPYILIYDSNKGMKVDGFHCTPAKSHLLVDAIGRHLEMVESSGGGAEHDDGSGSSSSDSSGGGSTMSTSLKATNMKKTEQQHKSTFPNTSSVGFQPTKYYLETLSSMN